ncbi:hypothetical protein DRROBERT_46 [Arthrobacter phage DrRobert]|uniref:dATP/dGTP diphosphohydrolase N-terminal domain-containing protein n=1 Tax=Arthrobacter phage DrRobert TaxID=1772296 RepID=A0A0U4B293_9CAUD|nr:hypothetical protein FDH56_gp46 [Arthrobacter phage DrRobert]ALY08832.1 hypothetical protein DRROBERT_46 [Arthrobacter phage DrRobert]
MDSMHNLNCAYLIPAKAPGEPRRRCTCQKGPEDRHLSPKPEEVPSVPLEQVGELEEDEQGLSGLFKLHGVELSKEAQEGVLANLRRSRILDLSVGEVRSVSSTGAEKGVKEARFDLIPVGPLEQLAIHFGRGAQKYEPHNWRKGYELSKGYAALQRHANAWWAGEDLDPEMGTSHLAAVAFHALALLELSETHPEMDDRYKLTGGASGGPTE